MIKTFSLRNYLTFEQIDLEFKPGLIVFSGPSGSGKSVLMNTLLDVFFLKNTDAEFLETIVSKPLGLEQYGIENEDENYFKKHKKEKSRYFINNQLIAKKVLTKISNQFIKYLHLKDYSDFDNDKLINLLDQIISKTSPKHEKQVLNLKNVFKELKEENKKLSKIEEEEANIEELKDFAIYELDKIEKTNPTVEEGDSLIEIKKKLSKKEEIVERINSSYGVFEYQSKIISMLDTLEKDSSFVDEAFTELRDIISTAESSLSEIEDYDIESLLDKIEEYGNLKRKYGSIEGAINYAKEKKEEIKRYENISFEKSELIASVGKLNSEYKTLSSRISESRQKLMVNFTKEMGEYLTLMCLSNVEINLEQDLEAMEYGIDRVTFSLNGTDLKNISTGEFNRLRLGLLALQSSYNEDTGVLMLDEIDSNLSGEESMSVAKVLRILSKKYQIYTISHYPQMTSMATQHFLVSKEQNVSTVKEIYDDERINEVARLISGSNITKEALSFAKNLIKEHKNG